LFLAASAAQAAESWGGDLRLYVLGSGMEGSVGASGRAADVNLSYSDVLSNMKLGFMGQTHLYKGRVSIHEDVSYMPLKMENNLVKADITHWVIGFDGGYRFSRYVELFGGVRINAVRNTFDFKAPPAFETKPRKTWVDPVVGLRLNPELSRNWALSSRFDVGGFGVSSKFTYYIEGALVRRISPRTSFDFGWRVLRIKYDKSRLLYDVTISGPLAGFSFYY